MLKKILMASVYVTTLGVVFALGAGFQDALNAKHAARDANTPRAILGLVVDGHWMGACITAQDYQLHCSAQIPAKDAFEIGNALPEPSAQVSTLTTPCGKEQNTKRDDTV